MRKGAGCLALQISNFEDEEDRAAKLWLAGNSAAVNQNSARLHQASFTQGSMESKPIKKGGPGGPPIALEAT
jgi:hypothetical protein